VLSALRIVKEQKGIEKKLQNQIQQAINGIEAFIQFFIDAHQNKIPASDLVRLFIFHRSRCSMWMKQIMKHRSRNKLLLVHFQTLSDAYANFEAEIKTPQQQFSFARK